MSIRTKGRVGRITAGAVLVAGVFLGGTAIAAADGPSGSDADAAEMTPAPPTPPAGESNTPGTAPESGPGADLCATPPPVAGEGPRGPGREGGPGGHPGPPTDGEAPTPPAPPAGADAPTPPRPDADAPTPPRPDADAPTPPAPPVEGDVPTPSS